MLTFVHLYDLMFEKVNHFNSFFLCFFEHPTIEVTKLSDGRVFSASLYCNLDKQNGLSKCPSIVKVLFYNSFSHIQWTIEVFNHLYH